MYPQLVKYLLQTYATNEIMEDTKKEIATITQLFNRTPLQYTEELVSKTLCCGDVYDVQDCNEIFITELNKSIRQSMRGYSATSTTASVHNKAFHATSHLKLQEERRTMHSTNMVSNKNQIRRPTFKTRGSKINLPLAADMGTNYLAKQSGAKPNVLSIATASTMTPPSSAILLPYASCKQASARVETSFCLSRKSYSSSLYQNI